MLRRESQINEEIQPNPLPGCTAKRQKEVQGYPITLRDIEDFVKTIRRTNRLTSGQMA